MFRRLSERESRTVTIEFEGSPILAREGETVAAALLAAGIHQMRTTPISGTPRAPYCMIGACFECLVEIDGAANRQACLVRVRDGMRVRRQRDASSPDGQGTNG